MNIERTHSPFVHLTAVRNVIPLAVTVLAYGFVAFGAPSFAGLDRTWLARLFMLEFLAIHSYPFLMIVLMWHPPSDKVRGLRILVACLLGAMYVLGAHSIADWPGVMAFFWLIAGTYFAFLFKGVHPSLIPEVIARGVINFAAFIGCALLFDLPKDVEDWKGDPDTLYAGLFYFILLTVVQLRGTNERLAGVFTKGKPGKREARAEEGSVIPTTAQGWRAAALPLLESIGIAILPYVVLPVVAGFVGRMIDAVTEWPLGYDLIRYWYFALYVSALALTRSYQLRVAFAGSSIRTLMVGRLILWTAYAAAGYASFLTVNYVRFDATWGMDEAGALVGVDIFLLLVLMPLVWVKSGEKGSRREGG